MKWITLVSAILIWLSCAQAYAYGDQLQQHLHALSSPAFDGRKTGSEGHDKARQYLHKQLEQHYVVTTQIFSFKQGFNQYQGQNLYAEKRGFRYPEQYIVISAHYDHLGSTGRKVFYGADDNASGVATLLELARYFRHYNNQYSLLFLMTDGEEMGLHGARAFMSDKHIANLDIVLNINLDMLGYGANEKSLILAGTRHFPNLLPLVTHSNTLVSVPFLVKETIRDESLSSTRQRIDLLKASDHYVFYQNHIDFLLITGENHHRYHTEKDTAEAIDPTFFRNAYQSVKRLVQIIDMFLIVI
ncbi:M28 family peptidase [Thalassotalea ponticola]|uniref:M28 family peptidase n=1 Tax=Thalassotalea ponticola TaxID=1523392 RepID=UPI0025B2F7C6|nr:M28 family peptidase [Thalassotalea ponticola]MDN3651475.1 M28 family peptidase [Thalassotalea ponticola]